MKSRFRKILDNISEEKKAEMSKSIQLYLDTLEGINLEHLVGMTHDEKIQYYADKGIVIEMLPEAYEDETLWRPILTWYSNNKKRSDDAGCLSDYDKIADEAFKYAEYIITVQNRG